MKLSYNGSAYHGWQRQDNAISVQQIIEEAYKKITGLNLELTGCGRTDTGVHARCYYANFHSANEQDKEIVYKLNSVLPPDIAIEYCKNTGSDFNARYSAISREYRYFIHFQKNPFLVNRSFFMSKNLDVNAMNGACKILMEYEDFASFCKKGADNKTTNCRLMEARWVQMDDELVFIIKSDRFLRNMVRSIVGALLNIGLQKLSADNFRKIIEDKKSQFSITSVPACGLYLWDVTYE